MHSKPHCVVWGPGQHVCKAGRAPSMCSHSITQVRRMPAELLCCWSRPSHTRLNAHACNADPACILAECAMLEHTNAELKFTAHDDKFTCEHGLLRTVSSGCDNMVMERRGALAWVGAKGQR